MRRLLLISVLAACLCVRASSQGVIFQAFEYPVVGAEGYADLPYGMFMVAGYAFDCDTGWYPDSVMITAQRLTIGSPQVYVPDSIQLFPFLYRPDVQAAYAPICPSVYDHLGYAARVSPPLPPGYWRVYVSWASTPYGQQTVSKLVNVGPQ